MKKRFIILATATTMFLTTACGNNEDKKNSTTTSAITTEDSGTSSTENSDNTSTEEKLTSAPVTEVKPDLEVDIMAYLADINADTELGEKIIIEGIENANTRKELYGRVTIAIPENYIYKLTDLKKDRYSYKNYNQKTNSVSFGYDANNISAGRTCTEIEFAKQLKKDLDTWHNNGTLPTRISEVQIGKYKGYEFYFESPSEKRSHTKNYRMWIDGYQVVFFVSYYNEIDQAIFNEAFNEAMQAIASVEKIK